MCQDREREMVSRPSEQLQKLNRQYLLCFYLCFGLYISYFFVTSKSTAFKITPLEPSDTYNLNFSGNNSRDKYSLKIAYDNLNKAGNNKKRCFMLSRNVQNLKELFKLSDERRKIVTGSRQRNTGYDKQSIRRPRSKTCKRFVELVLANGRTGNQMFEVAAIIGIAYKYDVIPVFPEGLPLNRYFKLPNSIQMQQKVMKNVVRLVCKPAAVYCNVTKAFKSKSNISIHGYMQSWKYFQHVPDIIRSVFKFKDKYLLRARQYLSRIEINDHEKVCIHVRRGDMGDKRKVKFGYTVGGIDFIEKARQFYVNRFSKVQFIVVSDDKDWCRKNLKDVYISPLRNVADDMALMTLCDHVTVTGGTFGWWGAWLANGTTVYFEGFPRPDSGLASKMNREDYYPPNWIGIS